MFSREFLRFFIIKIIKNTKFHLRTSNACNFATTGSWVVKFLHILDLGQNFEILFFPSSLQGAHFRILVLQALRGAASGIEGEILGNGPILGNGEKTKNIGKISNKFIKKNGKILGKSSNTYLYKKWENIGKIFKYIS